MYIRLSVVKASNSVSEDTVIVLTCGTKPLSTLIFFLYSCSIYFPHSMDNCTGIIGECIVSHYILEIGSQTYNEILVFC